jgi:uncharacterized protein YjaG (DUF416 family)
MLTGVQNFLYAIYNNWTAITVCIGLGILIYRKVKNYMALSEEEKIEAAKSQLSTVVLAMVSKAEDDFSEYSGAGSMKRSQVISEIYQQYPILAKVVNQEELIQYIDSLIDEALTTVREVMRSNG